MLALLLLLLVVAPVGGEMTLWNSDDLFVNPGERATFLCEGDEPFLDCSWTWASFDDFPRSNLRVIIM